jgi:hypothetical protein
MPLVITYCCLQTTVVSILKCLLDGKHNLHQAWIILPIRKVDPLYLV